jgi:ATP-dependent Lon protease
VAADALLAKVRELLEERVHLGLPLTYTGSSTVDHSPKKILKYLESMADPEEAADLVSSAVLPSGEERQTILETVDVETRLRRLIQFLLAEIQRERKDDGYE